MSMQEFLISIYFSSQPWASFIAWTILFNFQVDELEPEVHMNAWITFPDLICTVTYALVQSIQVTTHDPFNGSNLLVVIIWL